MPSIQTTIARELNLTAAQVAAVIDLVDQGNTIPFIARYRKEATGGIDDATLRDLDERLTYLRNLEARKDEVLRAIEEQGKLTADLRAKIDEATVMQRVEDLYKPYRKKRATRASKARDAGLEPLALLILAQDRSAKDPLAVASGLVNPEAGYPTPEDALQGAQDIVAEVVADDAEHVACARLPSETARFPSKPSTRPRKPSTRRTTTSPNPCRASPTTASSPSTAARRRRSSR